MTRKLRTAVLISGNGSNLQALLDAARADDYPVQIERVISNKADAFGLTRAHHAGVETVTISHRDYPDREQFDRAMDTVLRAAAIELVVMAGFMRILSDWFVNAWTGRLINIHPSLLPKFKGIDTHARALQAGEHRHGCTVHWVIPELDAGEIIAQSALDVLPNDTAETLQQRVHGLEHALYPEAVRKVATRLLSRQP
jgi:phosphoribosylglycinamide formyltransferase-1